MVRYFSLFLFLFLSLSLSLSLSVYIYMYIYIYMSQFNHVFKDTHEKDIKELFLEGNFFLQETNEHRRQANSAFLFNGFLMMLRILKTEVKSCYANQNSSTPFQ